MADDDDDINNNNDFDDIDDYASSYHGYNDNNEEDDDDDNDVICKIYDKEDFFTVLVQMMLGIMALGSLWYKRMEEVPRRTFETWALDVSKQAMGAGYAHVLNMIVAAMISTSSSDNNAAPGGTVLKDQCAWYGLSYIIDTSLGLVLAIILLRLLDIEANKRNWIYLKESGVYVGDTKYICWIYQVIAWFSILTVVKLIIYIFMVLCSSWLAKIGELLFEPLQGNIRFELVFVMILFPGVLNVIYFWVADSYLKAKTEHVGVHESSMNVLAGIGEDTNMNSSNDHHHSGSSNVVNGGGADNNNKKQPFLEYEQASSTTTTTPPSSSWTAATGTDNKAARQGAYMNAEQQQRTTTTTGTGNGGCGSGGGSTLLPQWSSIATEQQQQQQRR